MATRGRKPKPTAVKVLEGNPGKRPLNMFEPTPEKVAPECPDWLNEEAKAEWDRLVDKMVELGTLTEMDMAAFAGYCQSYARWKEAEEFIEKHGTIVKTPSGYWQQVPQVSIAQTNLKVMCFITVRRQDQPSNLQQRKMRLRSRQKHCPLQHHLLMVDT